MLSDIGANTLLLPSAVWIRSERAPNRLKALRDYVSRGGGLVMVGGYYSFQGINGGARYRGTPVGEDVGDGGFAGEDGRACAIAVEACAAAAAHHS